MKRRSFRSTGGSAARRGMPAISLRRPAWANSSTRPTPLLPCRSAAATSSMPLPMQETMPRPVITTRLDMLRYYVAQTNQPKGEPMKRILFVLATSLIACGALARDLAPVVDYDNVAVVTGSGKPASAQAVSVAISNAAARGKRGWNVQRTAADKMRATYHVRQHIVVVDIGYSDKAYSIHYAASDNMKYSDASGKKVIHPFYNGWVDELKQGISAELSKL